MALSSELVNLKSAGTYRYEIDKSQVASDQTTYSNLRLVVGFSKIGPFNTPVLVTNAAQFTKLFGGIDRSLEKKGSYFHRSALVALSAGPILALNLLNLDQDLDQVQSASLSVNASRKNKDIISLPLVGMYNTDKFYFASPDTYLDNINTYLSADSLSEGDFGYVCDKELLHFTNVGKKPISILVKKASKYNTTNFELTCNDWYGKADVPEYLNGTSYVSDYMVDVYVVEGDFGAAKSSTDVTTNIDLDDNDDVEVLKGYTTVDDGKGGYSRFTADITFQEYFDKFGFKRKINDADTTDTNLSKFLNLPAVKLIAKYTGSLIPNFVDKLGRNIWIEKLINDDVETTGLLCAENVNLIEDVEVYENDMTGEIVVNENIDIVGNNIAALIAKDNGSIDVLSYKLDADESEQFDLSAAAVCAYSASRTNVVYFNGTPSDSDDVTLSLDELFETKQLAKEEGKHIGELKDNEVLVSLGADGKSPIIIGDTLLSGIYDSTDENSADDKQSNAFSRITRVIETRYVWSKIGEKVEKVGVKIVCSDKVDIDADGNAKVVKTLDDICDHLQWITLKGFKVRPEQMPCGGSQEEANLRQNEILDMLREEPIYTNAQSNLFKTLIDRDYIQWRYLVDTFGYGIEENSKSVYTELCKARKSALAIINTPSQLDFKCCKNPSFVNTKGSVEAEYIAAGGDSSKSPSFLYSLPSYENGASYGAYYYPFLKIMDLGAVKSVPPAAYVSNLYISKYGMGNPWSIVAGQKRGVISGNQVVGVEATLIHDNRDYLEPAGINSIIWQNGVGVEIYANKTAQQTPKSALSSIHVREVCIYIQDMIENILRQYVFEMNTAQTRLEIKTLVDNFLENIKSGGGVYDYKTVMDTSNNTAEVIDNNMGVIDVFIEPVRGMEILVQKLTILKTGAIESGSFE